MLNKTQEQIAERLGQLLAESPLDDEIKTAVLNGLDRLPPHLVFKLLDVLEGEKEELERIVFEIDLFLKEQDDNWVKTSEDQKRATNSIIDKWVEKLK